MKYEKGLQKGLWVLFIDLKSAFDTVCHDILFEKMDNLGISADIISTIKWLYQ